MHIGWNRHGRENGLTVTKPQAINHLRISWLCIVKVQPRAPPIPPEGREGPCLLSHGFTLYEHTNNAWSVRERRTDPFPVAQLRIWGMSMEEPAGSAVNADLRISLKRNDSRSPWLVRLTQPGDLSTVLPPPPQHCAEGREGGSKTKHTFVCSTPAGDKHWAQTA